MEKHEFTFHTPERISPVRRLIACAYCKVSAQRDETIETWLRTRCDNNLAAAQYLLAAGLPPTTYDHFGIEPRGTLRCNMPEMGACCEAWRRLPEYATRGPKHG